MAVRGRGLLTRGNRALFRPLHQLFEIAARAGTRQIAGMIRPPRGSADMHTDIDQQKEAVVRRLRQLPDEMRPPYNWQEFQRQSRQRKPGARDESARRRPARGRAPLDGRTRRYAAIAAVLVAVAGGIAVWSHIAEFEPEPARIAA